MPYMIQKEMKIITSYAHIKNNRVSVNGELLFSGTPSAELSGFLTEAYKALGISYPKFHKMDALCKLGIVCAEYAIKGTDFLTKNPLDKIAIVLSNAASSLDTDRHHQDAIKDKSNYFPSPAVFVYTLPNIVIGEIAIKHKITGENAFFVAEKPDADLLVNYTETLFGEGMQAAICGWTEVDGNSYEAFIFLAEISENTNKSSNFKPLNQLTVTELYNKTIWTH